MKNRRFLLIVFLLAVIMACKENPRLIPFQSESKRSPEPVGSATEATTPQSTQTANADSAGDTTTEKPTITESTPGSDAAVRRGPLIFSSSLVGSRVKDAKGNDVGKIKDLLFDPENRRVVYAIVSLSNREIAVPLNAIKMDPQTQNYTLEMTEETLAEAPKIDNEMKSASESAREDLASSSTAAKQPGKVMR
jgi:sporulation protein YlmC with PRC-barrel domain